MPFPVSQLSAHLIVCCHTWPFPVVTSPVFSLLSRHRFSSLFISCPEQNLTLILFRCSVDMGRLEGIFNKWFSANGSARLPSGEEACGWCSWEICDVPGIFSHFCLGNGEDERAPSTEGTWKHRIRFWSVFNISRSQTTLTGVSVAILDLDTIYNGKKTPQDAYPSLPIGLPKLGSIL